MVLTASSGDCVDNPCLEVCDGEARRWEGVEEEHQDRNDRKADGSLMSSFRWLSCIVCLDIPHVVFDPRIVYSYVRRTAHHHVEFLSTDSCTEQYENHISQGGANHKRRALPRIWRLPRTLGETTRRGSPTTCTSNTTRAAQTCTASHLINPTFMLRVRVLNGLFGTAAYYLKPQSSRTPPRQSRC